MIYQINGEYHVIKKDGESISEQNIIEFTLDGKNKVSVYIHPIDSIYENAAFTSISVEELELVVKRLKEDDRT